MRYYILIIFLVFPFSTFAYCTKAGATVVYVNGILTNLDDARKDLKNLSEEYISRTGDRSTTFTNGYNPSHLGGFGDLLKSIGQAYQNRGPYIQDTDLITILLQIHPQVTTQKLLLVGHSQGTYYTNAMYEYLTGHGVSKGSISVYNLATPAGFVEGGGQYLTSSTDKVINRIRGSLSIAPSREAFAAGPVLATVPQTFPDKPLPPNATLTLNAKEKADENGGHSFSNVYLELAPSTIVSTVGGALAGLSAAADSAGDCFAAPSEGISYKVGKAGLGVLDYTTGKVGSALAFVKKAPSNFAAAVGSFFSSLVPKPRTQNLPGSFGIVKAIYGSSVSEADLQELLGTNQGGAVILAKPQTPPPAPASKQTGKGEVRGAETQKPETAPAIPVAPPPPPPIPEDTPLIPAPTAITGGYTPGFGGGGSASPPPSAPPAPAPAQPMTITYTFTAYDENGVSTVCSFDDAPPVPCEGTYSQLLDPGPHTFAVTATDPAGNQSTQTRHFTIR